MIVYWGIDAEITIPCPASMAGTDFEAATLRFDLGLNPQEESLFTALDSEISRTEQGLAILIDGTQLADELGTEGIYTLQWHLRVKPDGAVAEKLEFGALTVMPAYGGSLLLEAPAVTQSYNLFIPQGEDYRFTISFAESPRFATSGADVGGESVPLIAPLGIELAPQDRINFGGLIAVTRLYTPPGSGAIPVEPLPFRLNRQSGAKALNLTGYSVSASIWDDPEQPPAQTFAADLLTAPQDGKLPLTLTKAQTLGMSATLGPGSTLSERELRLINESDGHKVWQVELTSSGGDVRRGAQGFAVVSQRGASS